MDSEVEKNFKEDLCVSKGDESNLNQGSNEDKQVNFITDPSKLETQEEKGLGDNRNEVEGSSGSKDNCKVTIKDNGNVKRIPQLEEIKEEKKEDSTLQNKSDKGNQIQVAQKENEEQDTSRCGTHDVLSDQATKFAKIKMDMPTALHVMGYSNTLISDGQDPRSGLQCALLKKMSEIQTRQRKSKHSIGYRYTPTKARNDLCKLHEAYQFLSYKISIMKSLTPNYSNSEPGSEEEKKSNIFGLNQQKGSEKVGAKARPQSSSLTNRKSTHSTVSRPKSVPKSSHSNKKKKVHSHK